MLGKVRVGLKGDMGTYRRRVDGVLGSLVSSGAERYVPAGQSTVDK